MSLIPHHPWPKYCWIADGPEQCSGPPVARYSPAQLVGELDRARQLTGQDREEHITPTGLIQPFTWVALRKLA